MLNTYEQHSKRKLAATVLTIFVIAGTVLVADHMKSELSAAPKTFTPAATSATTNNGAGTTQSSTATGSSGAGSATASTTSGYKDGTYTAASSYYVPHGNESIQVNVTLSNGVITKSSVQNSEGDPTSASFQENFAASYKSYVVGQKLADLRLGVIAGASDTTQGFANALSQIASQAQA
ncbi:MAG TPA: hypothetical protein VFH39_04135 [Candidatus Saccharimonadales bacterium]|nr:hypothetical protein [Candidatus Saccharimonadales bacterium]